MTIVPSSAVPHPVVEWFDPIARTGAGYRSVSFTMSMIWSTLVTSTTVCGEDVMPPNQFFTVAVLISDLTFEVVSSLGLLRGDRLWRDHRGTERGLHQLGEEPGQANAQTLVGR